MTHKLSHTLVFQVLFDEPVTEDDAVRHMRKPMIDLGTQPTHMGDRKFCIREVKSYTRFSSSHKKEIVNGNRPT